MFKITQKTRTRTTSKSPGRSKLESLIAAVARTERDVLYITEGGRVYDHEGKELCMVPELSERLSRGDKKGEKPSWADVRGRILSYTQAYKGQFTCNTGLEIQFQEDRPAVNALSIALKAE